MRHFLIFGTHPRLSLAEFRSVKPQTISPLLIGNAAIVEDHKWDGKELMRKLGGTVKLGDIIATIPTSELEGELLTSHFTPLLTVPQGGGQGGGVRSVSRGWVRGGVLNFGLTVFGSKAFSKLPIAFKRALKSRSIASRWVTGKEGTEISPAAVAKLKLTTDGIDFCIFIEKDLVHIGKTTHVQDADAWSLRDYGRPSRDAIAGMLPPKLARMMVNLVSLPLTKGEGMEGVVLDPFCGSGTILMEAALATDAVRIIGSDRDAEQISDTRNNIRWLVTNNILNSNDEQRIETFVSDVRELSRHLTASSINCVVTEGMLGPPLNGNESRATLERNAKKIIELWIATLTALKPLLTSQARVVGIWPAFKTTGGVARVDLEPHLASLGYQLGDPFEDWDVPTGPLLYHRIGQKVMRRIVLLRPI